MNYNHNDDDESDEKYVYEIKGECNCCVECLEDENCKNNDMGSTMKVWCKENVCVECKNDNDCKVEWKCSKYGKCVEYMECKKDSDCQEGTEICDNNGNCVKGCTTDENCNDNKICDWNGECIISSGCKDNFDCDDYNHVCINDKCEFIDNDTPSCITDNDCSVGYFCNFEYLICIKIRKNTLIQRKKVNVLPICSLYGVVSLFVIASSVVVSNIAREKIKSECNNECSNLYLNFADSVAGKVDITQTKWKTQPYRRKNSQCTGKCRWNEKIGSETASKYAQTFCNEKFHTEIVSVEDKIYSKYKVNDNYIYYHAQTVFHQMLSTFCKSNRHVFWYERTRDDIPGYFRSYILCVADRTSIHCSSVK